MLLREIDTPFNVERFAIARYAVTWAQYRIFLDDPNGHSSSLWWWGGLRWRPEYERVSVQIDNHPVQEVSWYDAIAYCRWLSVRPGFTVRLPTEWEWQQAATLGRSTNLYAWGHDWQPLLANTRESRLRRAVAVGLYPGGELPVGARDMSGNVLEWCQNAYFEPAYTGDYGGMFRTMRGGSWFLIRQSARTLFRTGNDPYLRFNSVGFRLATSAPVLDA